MHIDRRDRLAFDFTLDRVTQQISFKSEKLFVNDIWMGGRTLRLALLD